MHMIVVIISLKLHAAIVVVIFVSSFLNLLLGNTTNIFMMHSAPAAYRVHPNNSGRQAPTLSRKTDQLYLLKALCMSSLRKHRVGSLEAAVSGSY